MKGIVLYYSHGGNTAQLAYKILGVLSKQGEVDIHELSYARGGFNLIMQLLYRLLPVLSPVGDAPIDLSGYETICIGGPVWAGKPVPIVNSFLRRCKGLKGKRVVYFQLYGVEASGKACIKYVNNILSKKGPLDITDISIPWNAVHDENLLLEVITDRIGKQKTQTP